MLAAWLWPGLPPARQRANLRQRLLALRQAAGGQAWIDGEDVLALAPGLAVYPGSPGPGAPGVDTLLRAWSTDTDEPVAAWAEARLQARVQQQALALQQAMDAAEAAGDLAQALAHARALVVLEPGCERHHRALMRLHYQAGDAASALAVYETLRQGLADRFGSRPSAHTESLLRLVLDSRRSPPLPGPASTPVLAALRRPPHCVGREAEMRQLAAAIAARQAVLVLGEAGLGKSRLLAEVLAGWQPAAPGAGDGPLAPAPGAVLWVRAEAGDANLPFATCARLLRQRLQARPQPLPPALAHLLPDLLPEWGRAAPPLAAAPPAPVPAVPPLALQQAAQDLLLQQPPAVVAVDDLHFADKASLELLTVLAAAGPETAADAPAWVLAQRPGEDSAAAARLRDKLIEAGRLQVLTLLPLTAAQTTTLLHSLRLPGLDAEALGPRLHAHTGGNPLYVLTTLQTALRDGTLQASTLPRPESLQALLDWRLRRLPERALALARIAALAGPDFSVELAEAVSGQRAIELADAWRELAAAQVLNEHGGFAHDLVLDAVLRGVPGPIARRLHGQVAAFLAQRAAAPARLAHHWEAAGDDAEAAQALSAAAALANATGRHREASAFHARAAAAWTRCGRERERFEALCDRVDTLVRTDIGDESLAAAAALEAQATDDWQRLRAIRHHVDMLANRGQAQQAIDRAAQAEPVLARLPDEAAAQAERIRLASAVAGCQALMLQGSAAQGTLEALMGRITITPELPEQQLLANLRANLAWIRGGVREAVEHFQRGADLARALGQSSNVATNLNNVAVCWTRLGHTEHAAQAAEESYRLRLSAEQGQGLMQQSAVNLARARRDQGRYAEALQLYEEARAAFEASGVHLWRHVAELGLVTVWMRLGQYARALALLQGPADEAPPHLRGQRLLARADIALDLGQPPQPWLEEAWTLLREVPAHAGAAAIVWLRARPPEQALAEAANWAAEALAGDQGGVALAARVRQTQAALALGDAEAAEQSARAALAMLDQGLHPEAMDLSAVWLVATQAALAAGAHREAARRAATGASWLRDTALPHVGANFVESFVQRQPAHRQLLALWQGLGPAPGG